MSGLELLKDKVVFLSVSKAGDQVVAQQWKYRLQQIPGITIKQHEGGKWNPSVLNTVDYLIVIPPTSNTIGKGQHSQIEHWENITDEIVLFAVNDCLTELKRRDVIDHDWSTQYACFELNSDMSYPMPTFTTPAGNTAFSNNDFFLLLLKE